MAKEFTIDGSKLLRKQIGLYGESGSGKSCITEHIIYALKPYIDQAIIVSKTEVTNKFYSRHFPPQYIFNTIYLPPKGDEKKGKNDHRQGAVRFIRSIHERQEKLTRQFEEYNNPKLIKKLYERLSSRYRHNEDSQMRTKERDCYNIIKAFHKQEKDELKRNLFEKKVERKLKEYKTEIRRKCIIHNKGEYSVMHLSDYEKNAIKSIDINPNLLLIFDDVAPELNEIKKEMALKDLYYMGRHNYITSITIIQADVEISPNIRQNIFISFFTTPTQCASFFEHESKHMSSDFKRNVEIISRQVFSTRYVALVYAREYETKIWQYHIYDLDKEFKFGSKYYWRLANKLKKISDGTLYT